MQRCSLDLGYLEKRVPTCSICAVDRYVRLRRIVEVPIPTFHSMHFSAVVGALNV